MRIPHNILAAGCGMFAPYIEVSPERLEKVLKESTKPIKLEAGLKTTEFCKLAGISKQSLWNWEKEGRIKLSRIGRTVRVPRNEAERILSGEA